MNQANTSVSVYRFNPLEDLRWSRFLERHPRASVFHSMPWLDALYRTYGYQPVVYTSAAPGQELSDGIVFSHVDSWLTGRRLVSLPFSDHCEPLVTDHGVAHALFASILEDSRKSHWNYVEVRPRDEMDGRAESFELIGTHYHHDLDLSPDLDSLYSQFHKNCIRRKIKRAEHEALQYVEGRSEILVEHFYRLLILTRRRHRLPPQPRKWFLNLIDCFGETLKFRLVYKNGVPVSGILTLQFKETLTYKSGCSDANFNKNGGMHLLLWKAIQEAKERGLRTFDFGRSETSNLGLVTFKDRWGATRTSVSYYSFFNANIYSARGNSSRTRWKLFLAKQVFRHMPATMLSSAGNLLYRHIG
jgi:CelD/BcsL family acetyltransferase involved in cellulose biosynthesis